MNYIPLADLTEHTPPKEAFYKISEIDGRFKLDSQVHVSEELAPTLETTFSLGDLSLKGMNVGRKFNNLVKAWYEPHGKMWNGNEMPGVVVAAFLGSSLKSLGELSDFISGQTLQDQKIYFSNDGQLDGTYDLKSVMSETRNNLSCFLGSYDELSLILSAKQGDETSRNRIIEMHLNTVRYLSKRFPESLQEDLFSEGVFGLMDAIDNYDPNRGVKFSTFYVRRVIGSMKDSLREIDIVPRLVRSRSSVKNGISEEFFKQHGRIPSEEELLKAVGEATYKEMGVKNFDSLSRVIPSDSRDKTVSDFLNDKKAGTPFGEVDQDDAINNLMDGFSRTEKVIVKLYYYEGMKMREVGDSVGLSESRISQMHDSILKKLKSKLTR